MIDEYQKYVKDSGEILKEPTSRLLDFVLEDDDENSEDSYFANTEIFPFFKLDDVPHPSRND